MLVERLGVGVRAPRLRRMAGAAQHASQALSTLSERPARSHTQRSECVPHVSTATLAHHQRCASQGGAVRVGGSVGGEVGRAWASSQAAAHGWCCWARNTDALHAERTHCSIAHAAERVRATRQHRHPCPPSAVRTLRWCGEGWWECWWRGWACVCELLGCGIWLVLLSTYQRDSSR